MAMQIVDSIDTTRFCMEMGNYGEYVIVANNTDGVKAYRVENGVLSLAAVQDDGGTYSSVHVAGGYIFCGGFDLIRAYTFDGNAFNLVANDGTRSYRIRYRDGFLYVARSNNGLSVYSFNGAAFALVDTIDAGLGGTGIDGLDIDGTYIYAATQQDGVRAYTFDGANLHYVNSYIPAASADIQWVDSKAGPQDLYVCPLGGPLCRVGFDGANFTLKSEYDFGVLGTGRIHNYNGMVYAGVTTAAHTEKWVYALDTRSGDEMILRGILEIPTVGAFSEEAIWVTGQYGFTAKSFWLYAFSIFDYLLVSEFDWSPKGQKAPLLVSFEDLSSRRFV